MTISDDIDYEQYGPQAHHLAALINRCAALTPQEAELLACTWDPALAGKDDEGVPKSATREAERLFQASGAARGAAWRALGIADPERDTSGSSPLILRVTDLARRAARYNSVFIQAGAAHAAKDTVIALAARDLIGARGEREWGWEQYDLLTEAWRKVIGPAHPDDPDMRSR